MEAYNFEYRLAEDIVDKNIIMAIPKKTPGEATAGRWTLHRFLFHRNAFKQ